MFGVREEKLNRGSNISQEMTIYVYLNKQASMLAATTHSAEISELKRRLERADEELICTNKQLEDKQGMWYLFASEMI